MKNVKTVSKLADARTEPTVLPSQTEHIQVQLQISAKARGWDICRGFCTFRTEIVSPVSLYLSRGGGGWPVDRNRTGRRESCEQQESRQRRPTREGLCHILERWSESLEERDEFELENVEQSWGLRDREPLQGL